MVLEAAAENSDRVVHQDGPVGEDVATQRVDLLVVDLEVVDEKVDGRPCEVANDYHH